MYRAQSKLKAQREQISVPMLAPVRHAIPVEASRKLYTVGG